MAFNRQYPTIAYLRNRAKKRIPKFAFDYLNGGHNEELGLQKNKQALQRIELRQKFLRDVIEPDLSAQICGIPFDLPFGVAPIGLQGLIWPNAPIILAKMAKKYNIPYVLSTASTASIERVAEASESQALFQLYNAQEDDIRLDLIRRAKDAGYRALFVTADMASFGYRHRDIRSGLSLPPKMHSRNIMQIMTHPTWAMQMLKTGIPKFETFLPYMNNTQNSVGLTKFMNNKMSRVVTLEQLKFIRNYWQGPLIIKGVLDATDIETCIQMGVDGVVISNHGARQFDSGPAAATVLAEMTQKYGDKIEILFDSGIESGLDIVGALATGATFTFAGRTWMYGLGALGAKGGDHTAEMFTAQVTQAMTQMGCGKVSDLPQFLLS